MNYAKINTHDIANGPGVRVSLFVSGCRRHCPGCHNPQAQNFDYGFYFDMTTIARIIKSMKPDHISGLTVLGGEPMEPENVLSVYCLLEQVREYYKGAKNIWLYSGFTFEELISRGEEYTNGILSLADVLVDGPYIEAERDITLKFRGSRNQRIIDVPKSLTTGGVVLYEL